VNLAVKFASKIRGSRSLTLAPTLTEVEPPKRKRPAMLAYDVNETPPWPLRLTLSVQHVLAMSVAPLHFEQ
jgi:hypothetical protein